MRTNMFGEVVHACGHKRLVIQGIGCRLGGLKSALNMVREGHSSQLCPKCRDTQKAIDRLNLELHMDNSNLRFYQRKGIVYTFVKGGTQ